MNLFLLENDSTVYKVLSMPQFSRERDVILCFNYLVYLTLKRREDVCKFYFIEDLLTDKEYKSLHEITDCFAFSWYKHDDVDRTFYNGVSFGDFTRITLYRDYLLSILIKYGEVIRIACLKFMKVTHIFFDLSNEANSFFFIKDDNGRFFNKQRLVETVSEALDIQASFISPDILIPSAHVVTLHSQDGEISISGSLRSVGRKAIERIINGWNRLIHQSTKNAKSKIYFFYYPNIAGILDYGCGNLTIDRLPRRLCKMPKLLFAGISFFDFEDVEIALNCEDKSFIQGLRETFLGKDNELSIDITFDYNGIDYKKVFVPVIRDLIINRIPSLLIYLKKVRTGLNRIKLDRFFVIDVLDEKMHALVTACRLEGVQTVFIDHGINGYRAAQRVVERINPDSYVTTDSFNPFGITAQALPLGTPSMDPYPASRRKKVSSIKKILFLTFEDNFYARLDRYCFQEKYFEEIFSIFGRLLDLGIEIYYKTHSENKEYHSYLFDFFDIDEDKIHYIEEAPFSEIIYEMDLMVCSVTTCFFEAQAAGVPAIFLEPQYNEKALLPPFSGINGEEVLRVVSGEELFEIIRNNHTNSAYLASFLDNFITRHACKYMGVLDGGASMRIMNYLSNN